MLNLIDRIKALIFAVKQSRNLKLLILIIIILAALLTVFVAQQRQELRQRATGPIVYTFNNSSAINTQGQNNLYFLAYNKNANNYVDVSWDSATNKWTYTGGGADRNFAIQPGSLAPSWGANAVVRWVAPQSGSVTVSGRFKRCCNEPGDANRSPYTIYSVRKNGTEVLWTQDVNDQTDYPYSFTASVNTDDKIEFWVDSNNDSGWDGSNVEFNISYNEPPTPTLEPDAITQQYSLSSGWNFIGVPVNPTITVAQLLSQTNGICTEVDYQGPGNDKPVILDNSTQITGGKGYMIKCSGSTTITLTGSIVTSMPSFTKGWQYISLPKNITYQAEDFLTQISTNTLTCVEVDRWTGGWKGHIKSIPPNNFQMTDVEGYNVKCSATGTTPAAETPTPTTVSTQSTPPWIFSQHFSSTQGQNNLSYLAFTKSSSSYANLSWDGNKWAYSGQGTDRNFKIEQGALAPSWGANAVVRWTAPQAGNITITGSFRRCCVEPGDANRSPYTIYSVRKGNSGLWTQNSNDQTNYPYSLTANVSQGENIEFWVDSNNDSGWDATNVEFNINYNQITETPVPPTATPTASPTTAPACPNVTVCQADVNRDGAVTILDFSRVAGCLNRPPQGECVAADVNGDGTISALDGQCIQERFNQLCPANLTPTPTQPPPTSTPAPTATPIPGGTTITVALNLQGVGTSSNATPINSQRDVVLELFDANDAKVTEGTGRVTYSPQTGTFSGAINISSSLTPGSYSIKVKTPRYLKKRLPGFLTIVSGTSNYTVSGTTTLTAGDIDGNNEMNIKDYDIFRSCFESRAETVGCGTNKQLADLNDDGAVNLLDYRLLFDAFATQRGD